MWHSKFYIKQKILNHKKIDKHIKRANKICKANPCSKSCKIAWERVCTTIKD